LSSEKRYYVYIMASRSLSLYTGVTNSIYNRALQHRAGEIDGFTKKYNINRLVYYETFQYIGNANCTEKANQSLDEGEKVGIDQDNESDMGGFGRGLGTKNRNADPSVRSG
jgi:putative endonuclease